LGGWITPQSIRVKNKSTLKQSKQSIKFLAVVLVIATGITIRWPNAFTYIILGMTLFSFAGDVINVFYIRRKARKDPSFLEQKTE
jgi:hypothetical protein